MSMKRVCVALALAATIGSASFSIAGEVLSPLKAGEKVHADMYRRFAPAVVAIQCRGKSPRDGEIGPFYGTGVVISNDGLILTSTTVIPDKATAIKVYFTDGVVRDAVFRSADEKAEASLIKVNALNLPYMRIAESSEYKVGDPVYSWGNPYDIIKLDGVVSLSVGSISGMYKCSSVDDQCRYCGDVIETDAAVNPGSDGGPITDAEGNLLGLMSLGFSKSRWLGICVPTNTIVEAIPELKGLPKAHRPTLTGGNLAMVWSVHKAFEEVAERAKRGTVALRVVREKDKDRESIPANLESVTMKASTPYPAENSPERAKYESKRPPESFTSGICISPDGLIITSAFNVGGSDVQQIYVYDAEGKRYEAKKLGEHKSFDLRVLKVDLPAGRTMPFVDLQSASSLQQGSSLAILGRSEPPGGITINAGRVSAIHRFRDTRCQISALMNYGNLGGPVVDLDGRVIGMASHLSENVPWRQNCGVGFMITSNRINEVLDELRAGKTIVGHRRALLGVQWNTGFDGTGAKIERITDNSGASKAGIKAGDTIVEFNGQKIIDFFDVANEMRNLVPGNTVKITISREIKEPKEIKEIKVTATLGEAEL